jgi:hypothetical protein
MNETAYRNDRKSVSMTSSSCLAIQPADVDGIGYHNYSLNPDFDVPSHMVNQALISGNYAISKAGGTHERPLYDPVRNSRKGKATKFLHSMGIGYGGKDAVTKLRLQERTY